MSRNSSLESPATNRRQPLLTNAVKSSAATVHYAEAGDGGRRSWQRRGSRMGETAGGCAAVCCCCPCAMVHLLILAVYRLPRCLWRRKKRRRPLRKKRRNSTKAFGFDGGDEAEESTDGGGENDVVDWDSEMWNRFDGNGFWRSASQRSDV